MNLFVLVILLALSAVPNAQSPSQAEKWNTIGRICGQLVYSRELRGKKEENTSEDETRPAKRVELRLYRGGENEHCCENLPLIETAITGRDGLFRFKAVTPGDYWLEASVKGRVYKLSVHYSVEKSEPDECKALLFELKDAGGFELKRIVTVD